MVVPANWTRALEVALVEAFCKIAKSPQYLVAGGKNLKATGWAIVVKDLTPKEATIATAQQCVTKWKRLKTDYTDYHFLINLAGYEAGFDDAKWAELDKGRPNKLSRFRNEPFHHYDAMAVALGDTMATGDELGTREDVLGAADPDSSGLEGDDGGDASSESSEEASDVEPSDQLSQARKRAKVLHELTKNKRKKTKEDVASKRMKKEVVEALKGINTSLGRLVELYAARAPETFPDSN
ncbi:hypothetical protein SPRG_13140 [Saprolegnia parasitica CBS 223.65]|uniref:Myb/SANT-like domain-containing protein n=1 Tax=Saprolegnia parasitica (strain CBS 223.65) TaxID=695850 RepID=A0A067BTB0_SAPPC|nr:hypothetical protein SPRG_13140 [Saprolegnia parasitica CBS 223.65]KDO21724.1 hypothetical protein SPRG_13140 [Saprolegnia parasitica CBS 223.65]|eukprot:XP_012207527.1 hypothetical protein SPRG_13140 [Saprolegnia parasitica CBS 223.65]